MMSVLVKRLALFKRLFWLARLAYMHPSDVSYYERLAKQLGSMQFFENTETGTQGLIAVAHEEKSIYIAFCGTQDRKDWGTNIRLHKRPMGEISIHYGVRAAITSVKTNILLAVESNPKYRIYITGHSLGGMCALATSAWLEQRYKRTKDILLVTIGAGKIGSTGDINAAVQSPHFRFQNGSDAVPRRPNIPFVYGQPDGENHMHIYFPNNVKRYGLYVIKPSTWLMIKDQALTFFQRLRDHDVRDYQFKLDEAESCP